MPKILYYDIDWFDDGLHPVWGDSDEESGFGDVAVDDMDEEISSQRARDHHEESYQEPYQGTLYSLSRQRNDFITHTQATLNDERDISSHMNYDPYHEWIRDSTPYYYDDDDHYDENWEDYWSQLVTADTYCWWWFPIVVERVSSGLYNWNLWHGDTASDYDMRTNLGSDRDWEAFDRDFEDRGGFGNDESLGWGPSVPDEIDEDLPNPVNFPPDRDYFIYARHPTDPWWPLS
ncbi:hypothetical protein F5Y00DRAFT_170782 [Daldinia vernicosa]|uniref:uncharacterized protein n=1 Tax=Daldinia vernicosa TaxID=114800 RepID=UPI002008E156|nr:uncharacterized protein F5Y00DRAFT_170782 [Daldinia vernicosa]KAI0845409.1 hypothetical protein F5Y00DRAFT_170782 [Daldinia vernicosa]